MREFAALLVLLGLLFPHSSYMEFDLDGKYLLGGLFDVHTPNKHSVHDVPLEMDCSKQPFRLTSYQRLQVMRFAVWEINNSTRILPNQSLGYKILDFCSSVGNLPTVLSLMYGNGSIKVKEEDVDHLSKVIGIIGPHRSEDTLTIAPLFMMHLIPMINYGAASSALSEKNKYPSFFRTVPSNRDTIQLIVSILQHYEWHWVAFITSQDAYGEDSLSLFISLIKDTEICLAYSDNVKKGSNVPDMFRKIENHRVNVVIVLTLSRDAEIILQTAITRNIPKKVWIAGVWSLDKSLPKLNGIENIGTIIGVTLSVVPLPGFKEYLYFSKEQTQCADCALDSYSEMLCRQACDECTSVGVEEIVSEDASYNFAVYSSIYAMANALHNVLECSNEGCKENVTVHPFMLLKEINKLNFTLLNQNIQFDDDGNLVSASYDILFWKNGCHVTFGYYKTYPNVQLFINNSKIEWHTNGSVPGSKCSRDCPDGFVRNQFEITCCFECEECPRDTYVDREVSLYQCKDCLKTEWSEPGSITCLERTVEYVSYTEPFAIVILVLNSLLLGLTLAATILFTCNLDTPVVKSAGGPMCVLVLACLGVASFTLFFYVGKPTEITCFLRFLFVLLYTICIACLGVRSFQIVFIFKMSSKFPVLYKWWTKYSGQWIVIAVTIIFQAFLFILGYVINPPHPYNDTTSKNLIIIKCSFFNQGPILIASCFLGLLCILCFIISYIGKNLPKNYNEAKAVTFCVLLLILIWIVYYTTTMLYNGKYSQGIQALAVVCSLYSILLCYFLPKCYIIIFQPQKNTQQHFQGLIQSYTLNINS